MGKRILEIRFVPAEQPFPAAYLDQLLPVRSGAVLKLDDVRAAIRSLFATGRFLDIQVEAEDFPHGVVLTFITEPEYFIGRVTAEGVSVPPNANAIVNAARLDLGTRFDKAELKQSVENITQLLRNNGFYQPQIKTGLDYDARTQQVHIRFDIEAGPRARYAPPRISGQLEGDADEIVEETRWKGWLGWKLVTESRTQEGLERLRKLYQRDRVGVEVNLAAMDFKESLGRVAPVLEISPGERVRVVVEGASVSQGKLRKMVPVFDEGSTDRDLLIEGARNLTEYFQGLGYFDANAGFEFKSEDNGESLIVYDVQRGDRHKISGIEIHGNRYFDTETIRERMYVRPSSLLQFRHGRYSDDLLERDLDAIRSLYRSNGFRDVEVSSRILRGARDKINRLTVHVDIEEGAQWRIADLSFEGVSPENAEKIRDFVQSNPGQPFSDLNVSIDRENILEYYYNSGYADANFEWSYRPADRPQEVNLTYTVQEGPRTFVRDILIGGLRTTDPRIVRERVLLKPGDPLSRAAVLATQRRLYNLQIFSKVDIALQNAGGEERDKYVLLNLDESGRYTVTGGIGAEIAKIGGSDGTFDSPAGEAGFSPRVSFDLARLNLWGQGHTVSFRSRVSTMQKRGIISYEAPQFRGNPDLNLLFSTLYDDSRDVRTFAARRQEGSVQFGHRMSRANTMFYRYTYRRVTVDPNSLKISDPLLIPLYSQPVRLGIVAGNLVQDRRDDPTNSHRGTYNTFDAGWASKLFGSQADFTRFMAHNATYHPLSGGNRVILARAATFGWLQNVGSANKEIPLPERFFGGGPDSHRGFPQNQAGPRDLRTGFPLGGRALFFHKVELRFPLMGENFGAVLFEDAGNLYSEIGKMSLRTHQHNVDDFNYMVHAAGMGIRYRTPVGPVRFDLAYTFNPPSFVGFKGTRQQLLFGGGTITRQQISHLQFHFSLGQSF